MLNQPRWQNQGRTRANTMPMPCAATRVEMMMLIMMMTASAYLLSVAYILDYCM